MDERAIGVFDSGVGGLTVVREIMHHTPAERLVYFGDTARLPYGSKSPETVLAYARQIIRFLKTHDVKAIVVACNTASAYALPTIEKEIDIPIIGVLKPGAKAATDVTKSGRIGVIATEGTIASGMYEKTIKGLRPEAEVFGKACPLFVPLVEEGMTNDDLLHQVAERYLKDVLARDIDTLIMGCTHYPLISEQIAAVAGEGVTLVNPACETAKRLKQLLTEHDIAADPQSVSAGTEIICKAGVTTKVSGAGMPAHEFYVSDGAEKLAKFAESILPCNIYKATKIDIEKY